MYIYKYIELVYGCLNAFYLLIVSKIINTAPSGWSRPQFVIKPMFSSAATGRKHCRTAKAVLRDEWQTATEDVGGRPQGGNHGPKMIIERGLVMILALTNLLILPLYGMLGRPISYKVTSQNPVLVV